MTARRRQTEAITLLLTPEERAMFDEQRKGYPSMRAMIVARVLRDVAVTDRIEALEARLAALESRW